jgi:hypothetical protein
MFIWKFGIQHKYLDYNWLLIIFDVFADCYILFNI